VAEPTGRETVAAIDCGTNTIKLLVGALPDVAVREMRMVRLGEGVDRTGRLSEAALARTFAAVEEYAAIIARHDVARLRFCATSASRDAANAADFMTGVRERLGVEPEVVSGDEEAALSFDGAVRALRDVPADPVLVVDIGGGSTELVLGDRHEGPRAAQSMDIGSVRLTERHLHADPATPDEVAAVLRDVDAALDACPVPVGEAATVVGVAGTITTVAAGVLGLTTYDRAAIDQAVLPCSDVHACVNRLVASTLAERQQWAWVHPGRVDVIVAGALLLQQVLRRSGADRLVVSEADILDGIAWSLVDPA
jgi:exopolyphosphatase/guanosine-5'-triphosphate,3'-diphosphate pyrophosphatase